MPDENQTQALAPNMNTAIAPTFIDDDANLGNENVSSRDLLLPTIKLLQAMSPECQEGDPNFVADARPGRMLNTLTHDVQGSLFVVPIHFSMEWNIFAKRDIQVEGPRFLGSFPSQQGAQEALLGNGEVNPEHYNIVESGRNVVFITNANGTEKLGEAVIYMDSTKLKSNREWNSQIRMTERPRFASVWVLGTKRVSNSRGSWFIYETKFNGYVQDPGLYEQAKDLNRQLESGAVQARADDGTQAEAA